MSGFRYVGVTDEQVVCDACGRDDLARTVILEVVDPDGNGTGETVRYGSSCAARALSRAGQRRVTGRDVLAAATSAHRATVELAQMYAETLAKYGLPLVGAPTPQQVDVATETFIGLHSLASWADSLTWMDWRAKLAGLVGPWQEAVAQARLIGWEPAS